VERVHDEGFHGLVIVRGIRSQLGWEEDGVGDQRHRGENASICEHVERVKEEEAGIIKG
jgi:hypothetical protein